ncbi:MAG: hypothetical protein ACO20H_03610 [Bacteriovoracaceae bacterium]
MGNKKTINTLFYSFLFIQILAALFNIFQYGTNIGSYFFLTRDWSENSSLLLERIWGLSSLVFLALSFWKRFFLIPISLFFFSLSFSSYLQGGFFGSEFVVWAHLARIVFPLFGVSENLKVKKGILLIGVASTFIFHGIEAMKGNPEFLDLFIYFYSFIFNSFPEEDISTQIIYWVGVSDIAVGVLALFLRKNIVLMAYLAFWGFFTALLRPLFYGVDGIAPFFERVPHFLVPILIICLIKYCNIKSNRSFL